MGRGVDRGRVAVHGNFGFYLIATIIHIHESRRGHTHTYISISTFYIQVYRREHC